MGIIFYGTYNSPIGVDEYLIKCPSCEGHSWHDTMISSEYFHIYGIPAFPIDKKVDLVCKKCGLKRYGRSFDKEIIPDFNENRKKFKHPLFTYSLTLVIASLILISILISIFS